MDELIKDFLQESGENLDRLDPDFVKLEKEPGNPDLLKSIFRTIHTIKGTCGFLGFTKLEALTHAGESLLSLLRDGDLTLDQKITDAPLEIVDAVRSYLSEIEKSGAEGDADPAALAAKLKTLQEKKGGKITKPAAPATPSHAPSKPEAQAAGHPAPLGEILVEEGKARDEQIAAAVKEQQEGDPRRIGEVLVAQNAVKPQEVLEALKIQQAQGGHSSSEPTIRVDVNLLEKQMNLVSELVLLRNRLLQIAAEANERNLHSTVHGLNYVTSELRKNVMKTRMQPVSQLYDKLPRIVRDLSKETGEKSVAGNSGR
jgi:two-component system chemotaxis sensor kinase CheA